MVLNRSLYYLTMMKSQITQNHNNFASSSLSEPFKELDHSVSLHCLFKKHESPFILICNLRNKIAAVSFRTQLNCQDLSTWRITAPVITVRGKPCFIITVDLSVFNLCSLCNAWIQIIKPFLYYLWILFICFAKMSLWGIAQTPQIFLNCADWHVNTIFRFDHHRNRNTSQKCKREHQLVKFILSDDLLGPSLKVQIKFYAGNNSDTSFLRLQGIGPFFLICIHPFNSFSKLTTFNLPGHFIRHTFFP